MLTKERIVSKTRGGVYHVNNNSYDGEYAAVQKALRRLYDYEELELSPSEIAVIIDEYEKNKRALHLIASGELKNLESLREIVAETAPAKEG